MVSGTPIKLLKLLSGEGKSVKNDKISFTVVFPEVPVIPIVLIFNLFTKSFAISP